MIIAIGNRVYSQSILKFEHQKVLKTMATKQNQSRQPNKTKPITTKTNPIKSKTDEDDDDDIDLKENDHQVDEDEQ